MQIRATAFVSRRSQIITAKLIVVTLVMGIAGPTGAYQRPGQTELVSLSSTGEQGKGCPLQPVFPCSNDWTSSMSATGRYVAFASDAEGLVPFDTNQLSDVFVRDRKAGKTQRVSVASDGAQAVGLPPAGGRGYTYCAYSDSVGDYMSYDPSISANGRYIAFVSHAENLVPGDTNLAADIFVHDRKNGKTERVSVNSEGEQTMSSIAIAPCSAYPSISASGRYVSFSSIADNLVPRDTNDAHDVFVHDRQTRETRRVSVASGGGQSIMSCQLGDHECVPWKARTHISADGRYVAFDSDASDLVEGDTNQMIDVFVHDRRKGRTERASVTSNEDEGVHFLCKFCAVWRGSSIPGQAHRTAGDVLSADGRYVVFVSSAANLVPNDTNDQTSIPPEVDGLDIFLRDRKNGRTERVSVDSNGKEGEAPIGAPLLGHNQNLKPSISANGRFIVWQGSSQDLVSRNSLHSGIFGHDRVTGATEYISWTAGGNVPQECRHEVLISTQSSFCSTSPAVSSDGRHMSFASRFWHGMGDGQNPGVDTFSRDRGLSLGVGNLNGSSPGTQFLSDELCIEDICVPPLASVWFTKGMREVDPENRKRGGKLFGGRISYRPHLDDLFAVLELEEMPRTPALAAATAGMVYGVSFTVDGKPYQIRAASTGIGLNGETTADFGLFSCPSGELLCTKEADLKGSFGTTGERITFSVPLDHLGLEEGSSISRVKLFTALGSYLGNAKKVIDSAYIKG